VKYWFPILFLAVLSSIASADTYTWSDENGTHFTDDLQNVPPKYQKKAMQDVRVDARKPEPTVPQPAASESPTEPSTSGTKQKKVAKKAKQYRRGKLLAASETTDAAKMREGCYLHFSIQPGTNVPWNPASYQSGVMKMDVQTQRDCLQDCLDNAQQKSLDAAKGWILYGRCNYFGEKIWSNEKTQ
jgi:hypothetical protein